MRPEIGAEGSGVLEVEPGFRRCGFSLFDTRLGRIEFLLADCLHVQQGLVSREHCFCRVEVRNRSVSLCLVGSGVNLE
jgi:hypothetical protein